MGHAKLVNVLPADFPFTWTSSIFILGRFFLERNRRNSVDPDQTTPPGAVWSGSTLFAMAHFSLPIPYYLFHSLFSRDVWEELRYTKISCWHVISFHINERNLFHSDHIQGCILMMIFFIHSYIPCDFLTTPRQNEQSCKCAMQRLRLAQASPKSDHSLCHVLKGSKLR